MDTRIEAKSLTQEADEESEPQSRRLFWLRMLAFFLVPSLFIAFLTVGLIRTRPPELINDDGRVLSRSTGHLPREELGKRLDQLVAE